MCVLAHVFEAHGLATTALVSVLPVAQQMRPPRALYCEFPLGRPLGKPGDAELQHDVLRRALALLDAPSGPVLETYPERITIAEAATFSCSLPIRHDASVPEAVEEARALRDAYRRTLERRGTTSVGRVGDADAIPDVVGALARIADGTPWKDAGLPGDPISAAHDVRSYYEEAALSLADTPPDPGAAEAWFYEQTAAGRTLLAARRAMKEQGAPGPLWLYMARATRS